MIDAALLLGNRELDPATDGWLGLALAVLPFALSTTLTPGPNTIMVTASGATFGFRRTVPHMLGILLGFPVMLIAVGWGLGALFESHPAVHLTLRWIGATYLLYLAWKIATAGTSQKSYAAEESGAVPVLGIGNIKGGREG